jgi:hypothetical protein
MIATQVFICWVKAAHFAIRLPIAVERHILLATNKYCKVPYSTCSTTIKKGKTCIVRCTRLWIILVYRSTNSVV